MNAHIEKMGSGDMESSMEKLQHPVCSMRLLYTVEQGGGVIEYRCRSLSTGVQHSGWKYLGA